MTQHRLLVLGAGRHQATLIQRANERGIHTIALDPYEDALGKRVASTAALGDAFDPATALAAAVEHNATAVITVGTDQTVPAMAHVAASLGLPCGLTEAGAVRATHKAHMRQALIAAGVPMAPGWVIDGKTEWPADLDATALPAIVKPADSQGQRGTQRVDDPTELPSAVADARSFSRTDTAVVESFVQGPEVTINAWVSGGEPTILGITDRQTMNPPPRVGICLRHILPSRHFSDQAAAQEIVHQTAQAYELTNGPLYIQAIATPGEGIRVIEAAARVGGGHEISLFPRTTGVDLVDRSIDLAIGAPSAPVTLDRRLAGVVNFVVARPGTVVEQAAFDTIDDPPDEGGWYRDVPFEQQEVIDSMGRIGYFLTVASDRSAAVEHADRVYEQLTVTADDGANLVYWPPQDQLLGA